MNTCKAAGITEAEWEASMTHTRAALDKMRISVREKEEFLEIFSRYKADIVEPSSSRSSTIG